MRRSEPPPRGVDSRRPGSGGGGLRWQPPVHSPVTALAVAGSIIQSLSDPDRSIEKVSRLLSSRYSADRVILRGSGTQALRQAIEIVTPGRDAIVAIPAFGCYDLATAAIGSGRRVALYDLDPTTLGPDFDSLATAFRAGAVAAVIAPLYGIPVPWEPIETVAAEYGVALIEDAAQGHGASWNDAPLGSLGDVSVLSFGRGKGWTGGGGGTLLLRRSASDLAESKEEAMPESGERPRRLAPAFGAAAQLLLARPNLYGVPRSISRLGLGETRYRQPEDLVGISPFSAALLTGLWREADAEALRRRDLGDNFERAIGEQGDVRTFHVRPPGRPGYLRFPVRVPGGMTSFKRPERARRLGIESSYPATLASLQPLRARLTQNETSYPGANELTRDLITLPTHSLLTPLESREVIHLVLADFA